MDSELTKAIRNRDFAALERLGCTVQGPRQFHATTLPAEPDHNVDTNKMVEPCISTSAGTVTIYVAYASKSETNQRDWKAKSRRTGEAWRKVREAIGPNLGLLETLAIHYAKNGALRVRMTRLGGRKMDRSNLPAARKGIEDAIAYLLGADDGDSRWHPEYDQEPGGDVGVGIDVSAWDLRRKEIVEVDFISKETSCS